MIKPAQVLVLLKYTLYFCKQNMKIITRHIYLDHVVSLLNRGMMIVLVGQRRVGKSYMLRQLQEWIATNRPAAHVTYINKEFHAFRSITTATALYEYVCERLPSNTENYLLVDEVQDIADYEDALRSLHAEERCQIVITGSNAHIFSSELSTRLSGRYIEIAVHSLTYREFLEFHSLNDSDESLQKYLRYGGMPGLCHYDLDDEMQVRDYLQGVYNTVMMRDVIARAAIRNIPFMENLTAFVADNIGKTFSARSVSGAMKSQGDRVSEVLIGSYLRNLCGAFILVPVSRYDIHGKRLFEQNNKYYFSDHGLRNFLCGFNLRGSVEKVMENVIRHHLATQGFNVTVGILRNGEVDFVATKGERVLYVQSTYMLTTEDTIAREFGNLWKIADNHPKYVVSMDPVCGDLPQYPGITHIHLREFLMQKL